MTFVLGCGIVILQLKRQRTRQGATRPNTPGEKTMTREQEAEFRAKASAAAKAAASVARFEVGKTYSTHSTGSFKVLARTAKQITIDVWGSKVKRGISLDAGGEYCLPNGRYSMAQVIRADRPDVDATETA